MDAISLSTAANIAEILGAGSIITGIVFALVQLRHFRTQQRDAVALNLAQAFYDQDLARAMALLQSVPDGIRLEELKARGDDHLAAAITIITSFETMGLLVFKRIATIELVMDLAGGIVRTMNRKLRNLQNDIREAQQQPSFGEWFEWLGDQAEKRKRDDAPAHIKYRDWVN